MGYKLKGAANKYKKKIIVAIILWAILTIVFVCPISVALKEYKDAAAEGATTQVLFESLGKAVENPFAALGKSISFEYVGMTIKVLGAYTLIYALLVLVGMLRGMPKNQYENIEHGSSDWSEHGEQYKVLSPNSGIILGKGNYLPVDKRGNVNVLVVGGSGSRKIFCIFNT